jgi:glycogen debranching enzyme
LCEVQAYVYAAKLGAAKLAAALGEVQVAERLRTDAAILQERFEHAFWSEELSIYVLALDGNKNPCKVRTSNAGHCLFTGIATLDHGIRVAETLMRDGFFTGWGIRTVHASEIRYNPMSYHNGSVWPHDNALIAAGFASYGLKSESTRLAEGLFGASTYMDHYRLPELFCGFHRRPGEGPTLYPVACSPQAWSAATPFFLLQTLMGLSVEVLPKKKLSFSRPVLPDSLSRVQISGLSIGDASVDVVLHRHEGEIEVMMPGNPSDLELVVTK